MPEFDGISEYVKSGIRRLRDAEELLQPPESIHYLPPAELFAAV